MQNNKIHHRYCQSCGMPLYTSIEKYSTFNTKSEEYCDPCIEYKEYELDRPMSEMVEIWVNHAAWYNEYAGTNYTPEEIKAIFEERLPTLTRWKQQLKTQEIHHVTIQDIIHYINQHLFETLEPETFAQMCNLSKDHFRKVFKTTTGESIMGYIKRLRLEQIANLLLFTNLTLEQIGSQTNYQSKHSLATAFKKHFGMSTSEYKEKYNQTALAKEETTLEYEIKFIPRLQVLTVEAGNIYQDWNKYLSKWKKLVRYMEELKIKDGRFVSVSMDDPLITPPEQCRFYPGVIIPTNFTPPTKANILQIPQGRYAIFKHKGDFTTFSKLYHAIYESWLPRSNYYPKSTLSFEIFLNTPDKEHADELITEVYIPVVNKE